ncbi:hypothetical protein [Streptomyces sp. NPDC006691]|uniref:hypothetical protein n=1 Tax=Streptomyces sp. NPDC006691 TaxID=3364757 RepID=UPI0036778469
MLLAAYGQRTLHRILIAAFGIAATAAPFQKVLSGGDESAPVRPGSVGAVEPADGGTGRAGEAGHEVRDVGEVGEVAAGREGMKPVDDGGLGLGVVVDGVVEGKGQFQEPVEVGESGCLDVGAQLLGTFGDCRGSGVLDQCGDVGQKAVGALVDAVQELVGENEFVVGALRVGEGEGQGGAELERGAFTDGSALLGFDAAGFECSDGLVGVGVAPELMSPRTR